MTKIVAVSNQKGGSGKTTTSVNISCCLSMQGYRTALIDADPQGSVVDWDAMRENPLPVVDVIAINKGDIGKQVKLFADKYDYIVIDCAPRLESELASVLAIADIVLVPVMPSPLDIWATDKVVDMILTQVHLRDIKAHYIINGLPSLKTMQLDVANVLDNMGLQPLHTHITARKSYRTSIAAGQSAIHSNDKEAMREIERLTTEIKSL